MVTRAGGIRTSCNVIMSVLLLKCSLFCRVKFTESRHLKAFNNAADLRKYDDYTTETRSEKLEAIV